MAHCPSREQLEKALAGGLHGRDGAGLEAHVEAHLEGCPRCQHLLEELTGGAGFADGPGTSKKDTVITPAADAADPGFRQRLEQERPDWSRTSLGSAGSDLTALPQDGTNAGSPTRRPDVPGYEILEKLGHGGMGVVYKAWHFKLKRLVALKMVLAGAHSGPEVVARFRTEVEAVARLQHPHIVQIHEVGEIEGLPYCTLEYVEGGSLASYLVGMPRHPREAATLTATLARTTHYAHTQGIVHRDLKPANILLQISDRKLQMGDLRSQDAAAPTLEFGNKSQISNLQSAIPKITDFGLAKIFVGGEERTRTEVVLGTPSYMSPEQAEGRSRETGPAADVYSLGAILYEMLIGRPPFRAATAVETVMQVIRDDPVPPTRLQPRLSRDMETICLKCLQKEPRKRYGSALALAEDLEAWLAGVPIRGRRSSVAERLLKWTRRHPAVAGLLALVIVVTFAGFAGVLWQWWQAQDARQQALANADAEKAMRLQAEQAWEAEAQQRGQAHTALVRAETALYFNRTALAAQMWTANNVRQADQLLDRCRPEQRGWEWDYLKCLCHGDQQTFRAQSGFLCLACSPDGKRVAAGGWTWDVRTWDLATGAEQLSLNRRQREVQGVAYRPDGKQLASVCADGTISLCDPVTGQLALPTWQGHKKEVRCVAYSSDGKRLATGGDDGLLNIWDSATGKLLFTLDGRAGSVWGVAFSPDGSQVATVHHSRLALLWDLATRSKRLTLGSHQTNVMCVAFNPRGDQVVVAGFDWAARLYAVSTGNKIAEFTGHKNGITCVAFSRDGRSLVTGSWDHTVKVWNTQAPGSPPRTFRGHTEAVFGVAFLPDGERVVSAAEDRTVKVWSLKGSLDCRRLEDHAGDVLAVAYSPDGLSLASTSGDHHVRVWDLATGKPRLSLPGHRDSVFRLSFSPDGRFLASASGDRTVRLWSPATGEQLRLFEKHEAAVTGLAISPDGKLVASAGGHTVHVWSASDGAIRYSCPHAAEVQDVAFSPDGRYFASNSDNEILLWDAATGQVLRTMAGHANGVRRIAFSPDGRRLASASLDKTARLWDVATGQPLLILTGHSDWIYDLAFSPNGKRLATTSTDWTAKLWDLETGQETLTLGAHQDLVYGVAFSPDGHQLATAGGDSSVRIWDSTPLPESVNRYWLVDTHVASDANVAFSPDGTRMATAQLDGRVQIRDSRTGWELITLPGKRSVLQHMIFSADARFLATTAGSSGEPAAVKIWDLAIGKERASWTSTIPGIRALAWRERDQELVTMDAEGIAIWNTATGEPRRLVRSRVPSGPDKKRFLSGAVSLDGKLIVAGGTDGSLHVWDAAGQRDFELAGDDAAGVTALEFTPDGTTLCGAAEWGDVKIWNTSTWKELGRLSPHNRLYSLSLASDGRTLALGDELGIVQLWDLKTRRQWGALYGYPEAPIVQAGFAPDGRTLAVTGKQGTMTIWTVPIRTVAAVPAE